MVTLVQIFAAIFFIPGWILYMIYITIDFIGKIVVMVMTNLPYSLIGVGAIVVIFVLFLFPWISHIPAVVFGFLLQLNGLLFTVIGSIVNLAIGAFYGWSVGIYNDLCAVGNLFINTVLENLCPNMDASQCIGLEAFLFSINNAVAGFINGISMLFDLFQMIASLGTVVMTAARQFNAFSAFGIKSLSEFDTFRKSSAGLAFASYSQNNKFAFDGTTSSDIQYLNDTARNWHLFTSDAPICPDPLCRDPSTDGMMYFAMLNASHVRTMSLEFGFRVPMFSFEFSQAISLDILTADEIRAFAGQVASIINAIFKYFLPVMTLFIYFIVDIFKLFAVLFVFILIPFLKPIATALLLFYYILGQPSTDGTGTIYVPSGDATAFLDQYVDSAIANFVRKYALEARTYLIQRADAPGPVELKILLLNIVNALDTIMALPSELALIVFQVIDKIWCFLSHLLPCLRLREVCDRITSVPPLTLANFICPAFVPTDCPCTKCKPDPYSGLLRNITFVGDGYPCVPNHSVSGQSCCIGSSLIHMIPQVGYPIFGIDYNGTLPSDVMFAVERNDVSTLMRFAQIM